MNHHKTNPLSAIKLALLLATGCTGSILGDGASGTGAGPGGLGPGSGAPGSDLGDGATPANCKDGGALPRVVRSLNGTQYRASVQRVLPSAALEDPFVASDRSAEFSTSSELRRFDFNTVQTIMSNAQNAAISAKASLSARFPCLNATVDAVCARQVAAGLGRELYREPVAAPQVDELVALFEQNQATGADEALVVMVRAMLASPRFLFRKELGRATATPSTYELSPHEIAGAIAFTFTGGPPDEELNRLADSGELSAPATIEAQALRLFQTQAGTKGLLDFLSEYLGTRNFETVDKDAAIFPEFDAATRADIAADFRDSVDLTLRSPAPTLTALLTTREQVVRPGTARLLGWSAQGAAPQGSARTVTEAGRLGVLTHPMLMATLAHQDETNPVARGHLVSDKLLCLEIPPPPQAVMFPERLDDGVPRTLRQTLEMQHSVDGCAACHQLMDPLGYPFESFDALGRFRSADAGLPIDTSGNIPQTGEIDGPVQNVEELLTKIAGSSTAHACFTRHVFKYVAGVTDRPELGCITAALGIEFQKQGGGIPELVVSVLQSESFLRRRDL